MESLIQIRGVVKGKLTRIKTFIEKTQANFDANTDDLQQQVLKIQLQDRIDGGVPLLSQFDEIQAQIEALPHDADQESEQRDHFENSYYSIMSQGRALLLKINSDSPNDSSRVSQCSSSPSIRPAEQNFIKLPTINLPKYSGGLEDWLEFRDIFNSLIHENNSITDIQKFHYLRASLIGDALQIIKSLEFTSNNYAVAWDSLCERYNNPRMLVHNHIKAIFNLESLNKESADKLRHINDVLFKHFNALKSLAEDQALLETLVIQVIANKLDPTTSREWETLKNNTGTDLPTLECFKAFLKNNANLLETLDLKRAKGVPERPKINSKSFVASTPACLLCKESHLLSSCGEFLKLPVNARIAKVKALKLCLNCLHKGHFLPQCSSRFTCKTCRARHHTVLHEESKANPPLPQSMPVIETEPQVKPSVTVSTFSTNTVQVLLPTASAKIVDPEGNTHTVRVLLDSGSQSNFISSSLCKRLKLPTHDISITVSGLSKVTSQVQSRCDVELRACHGPFRTNPSCLVIDKITGNLPSYHVNSCDIKIPDNIQLSDPSFNQPGEVDLLLGSPIFWKLLCIGQIQLGPNLPTLQKTRFGWVIAGPTATDRYDQVQCNLSRFDNEIQDQIARFWEIEHYPTEKVLSTVERACEAHFVQNTKRNSDGRFIVSIPLKEDPSVLGDSSQLATRRFLSLEKRLQSNATLRDRYTSFMKEYEDLGHMSIVSPNLISNQSSYYLPHHGVLKEESLTTKLRVVFDGSANTTNGQSLNSIQMVGPTIQQDLFSILIRFRKYVFAISADIEKMYRQVEVEPEQRSLQRILWRPCPTEPIQIYNLNTLTYGTASASFLAIRSLTQLGIECEQTSPEVSKIIKEDFYVDDLLTGADNLTQAQNVCQSLLTTLASGCFKLRKWISNDPRVLANINDSDVHPGVLEFGENKHTNTLGLVWSFQTDRLMYSISSPRCEKITKRCILSDISQIFDPLGLLSPATISAKMLLQQLWMEKLSWDDPIPIPIQTTWSSYRNDLVLLNDIKIPRRVLCHRPSLIEMHGFCDASIQGYGACISLRSVDETGQIYVSLLCAKAKVAPLKPLTIPKLELCGANLLSKLASQVTRALSISLARCFFWSDSTIVLGWLKTAPNLLKTFVCNRVADIQALSAHATWRHVPTRSNPADLLSRGISPLQLKGSSLWWSGPSWLHDNESAWPSFDTNMRLLPELRKETQCLLETSDDFSPFSNFSNLTRLERVVAYCLRFRRNSLLPKPERSIGPLVPEELQQSLSVLIKAAQRESFSNELKQLHSNKPVKSSSSISNLHPFLDANGIIRVGGRLQNSAYKFDKKHPVLISGKHRLAKLIMHREHLRLLHAGAQLLLSHVREKVWITSGRNLAKRIVHECHKCFRFSPKLTNPIMGNLPAARVQPAPPFNVTGVDYAGPIMIKDRKGRGCKITKAYLCLYVCFTTKAVHLELVTDLSTESFLLSLRRFVSRRGKPLHIYSDNGTNFVGASSELVELGKFLANQRFAIPESVASEGITWHFIPAHSPHFGGLWEAGIKSAKHHLKRVIGKALLTYEELSTLLVQIESILNSRPLSPLSADPNDLQPLTPSHFLIGRPLVSIADPDYTEITESRLSLFQRIQMFQQQIWSRWSKEYISELQQRTKWHSHHSDLQENALVLIKEDKLPPLCWKLGRIIDLHPGKDGINRVASIVTSSGIIRRSFSKICPLPSNA